MDERESALRFTRLWTDAQPAVAGFVRGMITDPATVDDVLQEVALALYTGFAGYDPARPFVAWALGIAKHKVHDRWRAAARSRQVVHDPELLEALAEVSEEMADDLDAERRALQECLSQVEGRPWDLLQLHYVQGHQPRDIAGKLGLEAGHVRVLLNRVRNALKQCVERRLVREGAP
jgi:RNA polymerase sigma-70 factor (ECF subfamily)